MALDKGQSQEVDLDRTDRLPVLAGSAFDVDVEDDSVPMDHTAVLPHLKSDFPRTSGVDLPSLAESVRSVEERIARQNAEYEALSRSYEKARDGETAAVSRSHELAADLTVLRATLEAEQARSRDIEKSLKEKNAVAEASRARVEETLRDVERHQAEARTLRDTLAARDANIIQVTHSLGERDAQLNALQREHAQIVPALEERSKAGAQLESELSAAQARFAATAADLKSTQQTVATLSAQVKAGETVFTSTRRELSALKTQAASYLETLRTREWRRGFDQNMFRELDAKIGAYQDDRGTLQAERDQLRQYASEIEAKLAEREEALAKLKAAALTDDALSDQQSLRLQQVERTCADLTQQVSALEADRGRLTAELAAQDALIAKLEAAARAEDATQADQDRALQEAGRARDDLAEEIGALLREQARLNNELALRDAAVAEARASVTSEVLRVQDLLMAAEGAHAGAIKQVDRLQSEAQTREDEMSVLQAQLREARRPTQAIEAEVKRLTDEIAAKGAAIDQFNEDNRSLRAALERARGALEEREFLIRRLERSESNNANVLGRIQTSIERLGSTGAGASGAALPVECSAELIRVDGQHHTAFTLSRRTRIGRAPGSEMQIDSSSVSRHHALVLMGPRDVIIEDLNSTNGVLVNGRKVSRQVLNDGDLVTIGDAQFRLSLKLAPRVLEAAAPELH
jgi:chromosome segregation ATPase